MTPIEIVRQASQQLLTARAGGPLMLDPPLSDADVDALESELPCPLPPDVRELLRFCSGFSCGDDYSVDFTGRRGMFEYAEAFPHGLPIATDMCGNFWVVDLLPESRTWGPIYYACHDAPVILYQSPGLEEFLSEWFKWRMPPHKSLVDDVHDDRLFDVWRTNPGVRDHGECVAAGDPDLRSFAEQLGPTFQFVDMRSAPVGFGFSWGRYGPETVVKRHGALPIFAYEKKEKRGLIARLFR